MNKDVALRVDWWCGGYGRVESELARRGALGLSGSLWAYLERWQRQRSATGTETMDGQAEPVRFG